jgi:hypothetical protein
MGVITEMATNEYGLDVDYNKKKLEIVLRDLDRYTPSELSRELLRLINATKSDVLSEPEFIRLSWVSVNDKAYPADKEVVDIIINGERLVDCTHEYGYCGGLWFDEHGDEIFEQDEITHWKEVATPRIEKKVASEIENE